MNIVTSTFGRPEIAEVWCAAVTATLTTPHQAIVLWNRRRPSCKCFTQEIQAISPVIGMHLDRYAAGPVRMYLEEDMIPVRQWSVDDYPGRIVAAQGNPAGQPWPALTIRRDSGEPATSIVPQRFIRDGGCPDWLPSHLCEPAMKANAKVLGRHFLHIDKMYRSDMPDRAAKNALLGLLSQQYPTGVAGRMGLGDIVASGLSAIGITKARVSSVIGRPCNCQQRQQALNEIGRKIGIG